MARRYYSNTAVATTISGAISASDTSITIADSTGWPSSVPFNAVLEAGTANEEVVQVTAKAGSVLTVTRGHDSTTAVAHVDASAIIHGAVAEDFDDIHTHFHDGSSGAAMAVSGETHDAAGSTIDNDALTEITGFNVTVPSDFTNIYFEVHATFSYKQNLTNADNGDFFVAVAVDGTNGNEQQVDFDINNATSPDVPFWCSGAVHDRIVCSSTGTVRISLMARKSSTLATGEAALRDIELTAFGVRNS